jgi:hypothetical protein
MAVKFRFVKRRLDGEYVVEWKLVFEPKMVATTRIPINVRNYSIIFKPYEILLVSNQ